MSTQFKLQVEPSSKLYTLTIRGRLAPSTIEAARQIHNEVAGSDTNIAAARSFGDISHVVFVPLGTKSTSEEILFVDQWNSLAGLNQFFSNPQVQQGGAKVFASRDPIAWQWAEDFVRFGMPPPAGKNDRFVGLIRGAVRTREAARAAFEIAGTNQINQARRLGLISREYFFRVPDPGKPASLELLGFDVWYNGEGMLEHYGTGAEVSALKDVFTGQPETSVWQRPAGSWIEW